MNKCAFQQWEDIRTIFVPALTFCGRLTKVLPFYMMPNINPQYSWFYTVFYTSHFRYKTSKATK